MSCCGIRSGCSAISFTPVAIASKAALLAKRAGARIVIVNAEPTEMDELADAVIRGPIGQILPGLVGV